MDGGAWGGYSLWGRKESDMTEQLSHQECSSKDTMKKVRGQFTECEEIFANYIFYKGLISRIHKEYPLERLAFKK